MKKQLLSNEKIQGMMLKIVSKNGPTRRIDLWRETQIAFGFSDKRYAQDGISERVLRRCLFYLILQYKLVLTSDYKICLP